MRRPLPTKLFLLALLRCRACQNVVPLIHVGIYVSYIQNPKVHGKFDVSIGNGRPGKQAMAVATLINGRRKRLQIRSPNRRTLNTHATYMVNSCLGKVAGVICIETSLMLQYVLPLDVGSYELFTILLR